MQSIGYSTLAGVFITILIGAYFFCYPAEMQSGFDWLKRVFSSRQNLIDEIKGYGAYSAIAYVALQALQVVLAPLPGELTGSVGGFIFGGAIGSILATIGLIIGSSLAFILGRAFGMPLLNYLSSGRALSKLTPVASEQGVKTIFLLFLLPGFPKDLLTYLVALSPMSFSKFIVISNIGRLPGTILLCYFGQAIFEQHWPALIWMTLVSLLLILLTWKLRSKILKYSASKPSPEKNSD
jgi:uncharacterized membrane protein YdjX (TVP38/TMEM64 family)